MTNELYHHGIKGQKWGIRRFQNADGSLTAEGRKRYGDYGAVASKHITGNAKNRRQLAKEANNAVKAANKEYNSRLDQLENEYIQKYKDFRKENGRNADTSKLDKEYEKAEAKLNKDLDKGREAIKTMLTDAYGDTAMSEIEKSATNQAVTGLVAATLASVGFIALEVMAMKNS